MEKRESLGSRLGFILLSAGCAIGCGNVWKFPWMAGQYGGGGFVLVYVIFLVLLGVPVMTMEFSLGRAAQASPLTMMRKLERPGQKWHCYGILALIGNVALMAFYTVVCGWIMHYFVQFLTGNSAGLTFGGMISNPGLNVGYLAIVVVIGYGILSFGLQGGLERVTKFMMLALFGLMVCLAVRSATLEGAKEGVRFYLVPDFSKITGSVVVAAMNQAFFTLSIGIGSMAIFGSYIGRDHSMMGEALNVIGLDTLAALLAGFIIFPACMSYGLEVGQGPALLFNTMATVFNTMPGGRVFGTFFFMFMTFAALSTVLAVFENILAMVREKTGWSRRKGSVICGTGIFLLALTTALGFSKLHFRPFAEGSTWLDFWDFIVSSNLLPLGSFVFCIFCCFRIGWGWENFKKEANTGSGMKVKDWMRPFFTWVAPAAIIVVYVYGMVTFQWR